MNDKLDKLNHATKLNEAGEDGSLYLSLALDLFELTQLRATAGLTANQYETIRDAQTARRLADMRKA